MSVAQIVISTAPHESQALAFNYASLALNHSFFLHHLVSPRTPSQNYCLLTPHGDCHARRKKSKNRN
jgi:Fe-Mn family superoxide dismutase